jgi:hypothetical protein
MLLLNEKETRIVHACQAGFHLYIAARFDYDSISPPTLSFCSTGSGAWHRAGQGGEGVPSHAEECREGEQSVLTPRHRVWIHLGISLLLGIGLLWGDLPAQAADPLPLPAGLTAPSQPTRLPTFSLPDVQGTTVQETALHGKVVIVRFWASW